ncbi:acyl-CoA thioesterase [Sphingobacterium hungaricum]|uniref:4-hydroxybenzoyl-CoA thioesterase n=1 Tax=Sphingobacterium hungaricum TaxID=2082723 RepID=A0A928UYV0_9SPHI|nr:acyl-CoA thioesterase [Sphingobacterium hungaricum]MBE8713901.1 4-hydroxybenzoyl-CoA thioesterase [Sphingobacterium hungaricum]
MIKRKELYNEATLLTVLTDFQARFNEVDSLGIVWHGHYIAYFEEGREAFGRKHGIGYLDVQREGFTTPIVKSSCEHKLPLRYGELAQIETTYVDTLSAKMIFRYKIYNEQKQVICTGETIQVFLDKDNNLVLNSPEFFLRWKEKVGLV